MDIVRFSIENPVKITVGVLLSVLFGLIADASTPVQLTPEHASATQTLWFEVSTEHA